MFGNWDLYGAPPNVPHVTAALWNCARWHHSHNIKEIDSQSHSLGLFLGILNGAGQWNLTQSDVRNQAQAPGAGQGGGALLEP